jgi:hypothetical protein
LFQQAACRTTRCFDENPPSLATIDMSTTQGDPVRYQLLSLPLYLSWRAIDAASRVAC